MTIGKFDRGCRVLILCALSIIFMAQIDLFFVLFRHKLSPEELAKVKKNYTMFDALAFATEVTVSTNGLLVSSDSEMEMEAIQLPIVDGVEGYHMAYSPSGNSYRLAAVPCHLPECEQGQERQFLYVLHVFVRSNLISKIEVERDPEEYFPNDETAAFLRFSGYDVQVVTNDGKCAYICTPHRGK